MLPHCQGGTPLASVNQSRVAPAPTRPLAPARVGVAGPRRRSGDPAYQPLPAQFGVLAPKVQSVLYAGAADGTIRGDIGADDLIHALSRLADSHPADGDDRAMRMTGVLLDGLITASPIGEKAVTPPAPRPE